MTEQEIREQIAKEIEAVDIDLSKLNALGMKLIALKIIRGNND